MVTHPINDPQIAVTSVEPAERKHLVQPYADQPVIDRAAGRRVCDWCGNPGFRRSRLRSSDLVRLLTLQYPTRCTRCGQRQYVSFVVALKAFPPRTANSAPQPGSAAARNWVEPGTSSSRIRTSGSDVPAAGPPPVDPATAAVKPPPVTPSRRSDPNSIW